MFLQLIFEHLEFALRVKVDELVEVAIVIHLKEEQRSLPDVGIGMLAVKPLLQLFCKFRIIHNHEKIKMARRAHVSIAPPLIVVM